MKALTKSKVFWLAIIQAVVGGLVIFFTQIPELVGYIAIVKSVGDIVLRVLTTEEIGSIS